MNKQPTSQELQFPHRWDTGIISSKRQNLSTISEAEILAARQGQTVLLLYLWLT